MSSSGGDDFLLDLFREEVRTNCQVLSDGLVALEQDAASPERLEAMMRAAHSIKGAARVVGIQPGVELSHAMEDCFVRAQKGQLDLTTAVVDALLAGVDLLGAIAQASGPEMPAWLAAHPSDVPDLIGRLQQAAAGGAPATTQPTAAPAIEEPSPAVEETPPVADGEPAAAPRRGTRKDRAGRSRAAGRAEPEKAPPSEPPAAQPTTPLAQPAATATAAPASASQSGASAEDGVVRVAARSLTRLMGLAGESLVEARWLHPFAKSLLRLKQLHTQLAETVEGLHEAVQAGGETELAESLLADARARLDSCRELLADRIGEFDRRTRDADDLSARLYREVISSRMRPFREGVTGLPRLVRDLSKQLGKKVQLEIVGESTEVDRDILEKLDAPINHLVRNALDHGLETPEERLAAGKPETGRLRIEAAHSAGLLAITISDDGRGIDRQRLRQKIVERGLAREDIAAKLNDAEVLEFLFLPGFSTAKAVTEISGRGVGLDVVQNMVQSVGGHVQVRGEHGRGASFRVQLPVTLSVLRAVVVRIAGEPYAFPHNRIERLLRVGRDELHSLENRQYIEVDGENVGIVMARQILQLDGPQEPGDELVVVLFGERTSRCGLVVDAIHGEQDLVVRPLDRRLGKVPNLNAAAILDDGSPVLIVDPDDLRRSLEKLLQATSLARAGETAVAADQRRQCRILVVDDSITVREVERQLLANQGYHVETAVDGMEGWNMVREGRFDLVVSDIDMPRLNGLDLVRRIKADARLAHLPVIIVSYKDREEDRMRGLEAGANYYLTKSSFHDDTLVQSVRALIGNSAQ